MTLPDSEECLSDSPPAKKIKRDKSPQPSTSFYRDDYSLLDFCDDLILEILSHVGPTDLLALSQCCKRLQRIAKDRILWTNVDFRSLCLSDSELKKYIKFFLPSTKVIATKGPRVLPPLVVRHPTGWPVQPVVQPFLVEPANEGKVELTLSAEFLESIADTAPNLVTLIIENHVLDSPNISWNKIPSRIEHLSLKCCQLTELDPHKSFFFDIDRLLPNLKVLDLTQCYWFESHSLLSLSKCKRLQELRLADCLLKDFVPYISLGARFGFKALTVIDLRRTWVTDREVTCLSKTPNLHELYLEAPDRDRGMTLISDMGVTAFGATVDVWNRQGYFVLLMPDVEEEVFTPSPLRIIQLLNFTRVTDTSLRHCAICLKGLQRIDVRGTCCTQAGINYFKAERPDVVIESDFNVEVDVGSAAGSVDNT